MREIMKFSLQIWTSNHMESAIVEGSRNSESLASLHIASGGRVRVTSIAPHSRAGKMAIVPLHLLAPALTATGAPHPKSTSKQGNLEDPVTPKSFVRPKLYLKYLFPCRPTQSRSSCTFVEFAFCLMAACTDLAANPRSLDPSSPAVEIASTLHNMLPNKKGGGLGETRCRQSTMTLNLVISFGGSILALVALRHMCP